MTGRPTRVVLVWCPQWSIRAAQIAHGIAADARLALVDRGVVVAASSAATAEGVAVGLRTRQAQHRCPDLTVLPHSAEHEQRAFEPVLRALEDRIPHVHVVRPGLVAARAQELRRFYGSEQTAAQVLLQQVEAFVADARAAVADGLFTAEHAAYGTTADRRTALVPPGESASFLAPLPVSVLDDVVDSPRMTSLLRRMGIRTLGDLAALPQAQVHSRFGAAGLHAHRLASGDDLPSLSPRIVPKDLDVSVTFEPACAQAEQIVARCDPAADAFMAGLAAEGLVCHEIRLRLHTEAGDVHERVWRHPWQLTSRDVLDRLAWQLQDIAASGTAADDEFLSQAVTLVHLQPVSVDDLAHNATGLWGDRPDENVVQALGRLQHQLGYDGVLTAAVGGGRMLDERRILRPWGDALPDARERRTDQPWPGSLPGPAPATVFAEAHPVQVLDADGAAVGVDERGATSAEPHWLCPTGEPRSRRRITAWAGPWPVQQRWWRPPPPTSRLSAPASARKPRVLNRFQLIDEQSQAWVVLAEDGRWWAEARYD